MSLENRTMLFSQWTTEIRDIWGFITRDILIIIKAYDII